MNERTVIPIVKNPAALESDGVGCHAGADQMHAAARAAGKGGVLDQYANDYPKGPHDQPQSMCPAFGSLRVGLRVHRVADVLEQLAGDQRLAVEGHIAHAAARAVEVAGEGQAVHAAGAAAQDGGGAAHAQAHAQRTEGRAHALRLVVRAGIRALRVVGRVLRQHLALAGLRGGLQHLVLAGVAAQSVHGHGCAGLGGGCSGLDRDGAGHGGDLGDGRFRRRRR